MSTPIDSDFKLEATELLDTSEEALLELESGANFDPCYQTIFRAFHSIKGAAGMFEIKQLEKIIHHMEDLLENQKSQGFLPESYIQYFLKGLDASRKVLDEEEVDFELIDPEKGEHSETKEPELDTSKSETTPQEKDHNNFIEQARLRNAQNKEQQKYEGLVFVVDDEQDILDIIESELQEAGYKTKCFLKAQEALDSLEASSPDLIITDINMPEIDGLELLQRVHKSYPQLPLIIVSGYITKEICIEALSSGVSGVIEKPFDSEKLIRMCHTNIQKYRSFKLLQRSVHYMLYQFTDLDEFLEQSNKHSVRDALKSELKKIIDETKRLKKSNS
jgi:CheY-like chemotaxis protein/HPt (histidine-containing phosphotransfer) domain-containing protein